MIAGSALPDPLCFIDSIDQTPNMTAQDKTARVTAVREILRDVITRRSAGETITDQSIIEEHPELMPELADELRSLDLVQLAAHEAKTVQTALQIRCPHCHHPGEWEDEADTLPDVICQSCQHLIAGVMAVLIIDVFEVVNIKIDYRKCATVTFGLFDLAAKKIIKLHTVAEFGHYVRGG